jgi:predicted alpha/beta superfamily hydrolase
MTKKKLVLIIAATALLTIAGTLTAWRLLWKEEPEPPLPEHASTLQSTVLGEQRAYTVHLPQGYEANPTARYPVLYVLDGSLQAEHTAESASLQARTGIIPPIIVVGILNGNKRERDYTPPDQWVNVASAANPEEGGQRFLSFLEKELIPKIEADYRTARPRMLAGWSLGGLFVLYSQIAAPSLFDGRFAHSPAFWGDNDENLGRFQEGWKGPPPAGFLYISMGDQEAQETVRPFTRVMQVLESTGSSTFKWEKDFSAGGTHNSNPRLSTPVGLCLMFAETSGQACRPTRR